MIGSFVSFSASCSDQFSRDDRAAMFFCCCFGTACTPSCDELYCCVPTIVIQELPRHDKGTKVVQVIKS